MKWLSAWLCLCAAAVLQADTVILDNFAEQIPGKNVTAPWTIYGRKSTNTMPDTVTLQGKKVIRVQDTSTTSEVGVIRRLTVAGNKFIRVTPDVTAMPGQSMRGAYVQIRFYPSNKFKQWDLAKEVYTAEIPEGTTLCNVYLYCHAAPRPAFYIHSVKFEVSANPFPVPKKDPRKEPGVLTDMKRDLCIQTALVKNGKPAAVIAVPACYRELAEKVSGAVKAKTGTALPIVSDTDFARMQGLKQNLILLGNRDDNAAISRLYGFHYTLLDACYPGPAGNELRSAHNIFGDKYNVIFAGSSSAKGTADAVAKLLNVIAKAPAGKTLELGYLMDITLDPAKKVPAVSDSAKIWEASRGYGEKGTFSWNQLSKNLALFYMTGDTKFAKEFVRLSFPTPAIAKEILRRDDEAIHNPMRPLATPYHYRALQIILYWDLVEEHPFFDGIREKITAEFYEQNAAKSRNRKGTFSLRRLDTQAGNRHAAWEALSTWGIARYFYKHYQTKDGELGLECAEYALGSARKYMALEAGSLFWFNTFMEPVISYMILSGAEEMQGTQPMKDYCHALMSLSSGTEDWTSASTAYNMYSKLAWLTDDEAPVELLRQSVPNPQEFRLGQSWYPRKPYRNNYFRDCQGNVFKPAFSGPNMRCFRPRPQDSKIEDLAQYLSYRKDADFLLLDTKYEQGRNPFHNFAVIRLDLAGMPVLAGHYNTMHLFCNGISSGRPGFFTDFRKGYGKLDTILTVDGTVPDTNDHDWNRVLVTRQDRWMLAVDTVTPRVDMAQSVMNLKYQSQLGNVRKLLPNGDLELARNSAAASRKNGVYFFVQDRKLLALVQHANRYYSGFLSCVGIRDLKIGEKVNIEFNLAQPVKGEVVLTMRGAAGAIRGNVHAALDGKTIVRDFQHFSTEDFKLQPINLGVHDLAAGKHTITLTAASFRNDSGTGLMTLQSLSIHREGCMTRAEKLYAVVSCGLPTVPEVENITASAAGASQAVSWNFMQPGKAGQAFKLVSLTRRGKAADTASAAQEGHETALLLPEPALLTLRDEGFFLNSGDLLVGYRVNMPELSGVKGIATFEYNKVSGKRTVRLMDGTVRSDTVKLSCPEVPEEKIRTMLARKARPEGAAQINAPRLVKAWGVEGPGFPGAPCSFTRNGESYFVLAHGNCVRLYTFGGRLLWEQDLKAPTGAVCYWASQDLIITGSRNEKITAWSFDGQLKWSATAEMSKYLIDSVKHYWFKKALPGVTMLHVGELGGREWLFAGGTGTVEVYDAQGKLDSRHWGEWGYTSEAITLPGEVRFIRHMGANPNVMAARMVNGKIVVLNRGMAAEKAGGDMGRFGFSMVGRWGILAGKLAPGREMQTVETLNGVHNRLIIRNLNGRIQYEADLGPGFVAQTTRYGQDAVTRRNVKGLILQGPDKDGRAQIVLAFNRKFVAAFDPELRVRWMLALPDQPTRLLALPGDRVAVGCADGTLLLLDREGKTLARRKLDGMVAEMVTNGKLLVVADSRNTVTALILPEIQ